MAEKEANRTSIRYKLIVAFLLQSSFLGIFICYSTRKILNSELLSRGLSPETVSEILFQFTTVITGLTFFGIILALLISFLFSKSISSGLKKLMDGLQEIKRRNLKHVIKVESNDEIGELAESFNMMAKELHEREEDLNKSARELKKANVELTAHREHLEELVDAKTEQLMNELEKHKLLENDIRQILDASSDAIRVVDKNYNIVYASKSLFRLKDIDDREIIGKKCYEVDPEEGCFTDECSLRKILKTGEKYELETFIKSPDGSETPYLIRSAPYTDSEDRLIGVVKSYKDITEEKNAREMAEEHAQQQGRIEMANNMLHDIGNALTGISVHALKPQTQRDWTEIKSLKQLKELFASHEKGLAGLLGRDRGTALLDFIDELISSLQKRNASNIDFFKKISSSVGHISSVLDLQRHYMKEKSAPLSTEINLKSIIEDCLVMLAGSLEKRAVEVKLSLGGKVPIISGDQTRLIRGLLNIVKNTYESFDALEANESRKLEIEIAADEEKRNAEIIFLDNASGFSREVADKLFDWGFTTKERGSGIGLHEARLIINSHGGTISIESKGEGKGARTIVKFPLLKTKKG